MNKNDCDCMMIKKNKKLLLIFGFFLIVLVAVVYIITSIRRSDDYTLVKKRFFRMDTVTELTVAVKDKKSVEIIWQRIDSLLKEWEEHFSVSHPRSEVKALNERRSQTVEVSSQMAEMISKGLQYGELLDGGFDITILPIKELWGFVNGNDSEVTVAPSQEMVRQKLENVDYRNVEIYGDTVSFKSQETRIDVGGIAKGFVLREIGKTLDSYGINDYLICAGGDILARGKRVDGKPWRIGIADPRNPDSVAEIINVQNCSVVTSGDYERFRFINGKRYHHLFDPKTGYSCLKNRSVTVYGKDPVAADILSTGLFCRDASEIVSFINGQPGLQCFVIDSEGRIHTSKNWNKINSKG